MRGVLFWFLWDSSWFIGVVVAGFVVWWLASIFRDARVLLVVGGLGGEGVMFGIVGLNNRFV